MLTPQGDPPHCLKSFLRLQKGAQNAYKMPPSAPWKCSNNIQDSRMPQRSPCDAR